MKLLARITKPRVVAALLIASGITALMGSGFSGWLRQAVSPALAPLGDGGIYLATLVKRQIRKVTARGLSGSEAEALREENVTLHGQLITLESELARRIQQQMEMDSLYGRLKRFPCMLFPARVVTAESLPYGESRVVNAGTSRGVRPGALVTTRRLLTDRSKSLLPQELAVLSRAAMVGRITATGPFTARLQLVTDSGFRLRARIRRTIDPRRPRQVTVDRGSRRAIEMLTDRNNAPIDVEIRGAGADGIVASVYAYYNVKPGDWRVTSGREAFLPAEIRIGSVVEVAKEAQHPGFVKLTIKPHADLDTLHDVYIVYPLGKPPAEGPRGGRR